jgi:hypothetical protein
MKDQKGIYSGTELVNFIAKPGLLMFFPGYLEHEFSVDHGKSPFRFIHFNVTAILKDMSKDV